MTVKNRHSTKQLLSLTRTEKDKRLAPRIQAISKEHPDKRIEAWFEDEARFGQQGSLASRLFCS